MRGRYRSRCLQTPTLLLFGTQDPVITTRMLGGFEPYAALPHLLFEVGSSLEACDQTRNHVTPCLIVSKRSERTKAAS